MATNAGMVAPEAEAAREAARFGWLAMVLTPGMGATRTVRAARLAGGAERVLDLPLTQLEGLRIPAKAAQFLADGRARKAAEDELKAMEKGGITFVTPEDELYPQRLLEIYDPPAVLWVRGDARLLNQPGIAVVGTRVPSTYGAGMAEMLSRELALRGMVIQSGMARGVDTAAHKGALAAGGKTVAVWGTGLDVIYPKENKSLAEQIVRTGGALVSEFPLGTFPAVQNFPIRNRTLSGISVGVLVVEAAEFSGTRITARCAMEQNRDLYAVPGNVTNKNAWGPNTLIKQGARLTATWEDIWEDLPSHIRQELDNHLAAKAELAARQKASGILPESKPSATASLFSERPLTEPERLLLDTLRADESTQLDDVMERLEGAVTSAEIFTAIFELETAGRIKSLPGKNYIRTL